MEAESAQPVACLGEALVDLIATGGRGPGERERFEVYCGGALANVAVAVSRAGTPAALVGGRGTDGFGRMLTARLEQEGIDLGRLVELEGLTTPFAFVRIDPEGEPEFEIHGEGIDDGVAAHAGREAEIAEESAAIVVGSNTLVGSRSRSVTLALAEAASEAGTPLLFDPNLRLHRWEDEREAVSLCRELIPRARLLKANVAEARRLAGAGDRATAKELAPMLLELGPELVVVTDGGEGAVVAAAGGPAAGGLHVPAPTVEGPLHPLGAGDALMGTLAARLVQSSWDPEAVPHAVESAVEAGALACIHIGAID